MNFIHGAQYWRNRAKAASRAADGLNDPELKRIVLGMSAAFGVLALLSTEWEKLRTPGGAS